MATRLLAALPLLLAGVAVAENDGFGRTPVMGYNTYNAIWCAPNQTIVHDTITALSERGFVDLGYKLMMIDCGWFSTERAANGSITYDTTTFPDGIAPLSQYAISKGMQWSMYTGATPEQCMPGPDSYPASQYYEMADAMQFAGWNTVLVKADNCDGPDDTLFQRYTNMSNALQRVGIDGLAVCEWGTPANGTIGPEIWTKSIATSWRISADIAPYLQNTQWTADIFRITNEAIQIIRNGNWGPGSFGDMDLLEVGNEGLTQTQQQSHFAIWAMFKSPLWISTHIHNMTAASQSILNNTHLIAINQDSLGAPVSLVQRYPDYDVYACPLSNGDKAVLIVDQSGNGGDYYLDFTSLNVSSANVLDLIADREWNDFTNWYANVGPNGASALRLSNIQAYTPPQVSYNTIQGSSGTFGNGASAQPCSACSTGQAAGYLGGGQSNGGGSVTYSNIRTSQSTQNIKIDYINAEYTYPNNEPGINARGAQISVNGGNPVDILFPVSGYDWSSSVLYDFLVELSGFSTSGTNTITVTGIPNGVPNTSNYAPNIAAIHVVS